MTTPPGTPPMGASDEAEPDQPGVARAEGDADTRALQAMDQESGAVTPGAGDDLVAFVQEPAEAWTSWTTAAWSGARPPSRPTRIWRSLSPTTPPTAASCPPWTSP
jgi:hypothetical protein